MRALLLAALLAASPALARPLAEVERSGVLRVTVYQDYKPYSWRRDGKPVGVDVEIAALLAERPHARLDLLDLRADEGLEDDLRNGAWKGSLVGAAPGGVMLHAPYDKRIEQRNDRGALAAPYHVDGQEMIGVAAGWGGAAPLWGGDVARLVKDINQGGAYWVFRLPQKTAAN